MTIVTRNAVETWTYREAIRNALADEMRDDPTVVLLGEDIGHAGGVFKVCEGLYDEFGGNRVIDTPISETAFTGAAIGMAITGLRPVVEIMFADFMAVCFDQLVNSMAKYRYMSGGQTAVPMVVRTAGGGGIRFAAQHSQTGETWLLQFPGLKIVCPSSPHDAYHLTRAAIRDDNPVVIIEHKALYAHKGEVELGSSRDQIIGKANICRKGSDVTLVATLAMVNKALEAAEALSKEGIEAEVIDLRSLRPLDTDTVIQSVKKTCNLITIEENHAIGGWGSEVVSRVVEEAFDYLDSPPQRITLPDAPIPFSPVLEDAVIPSVEKIIQTVKEILK
jgi:acetoin:2,6-dichlorophenolindophenol oxidoreductase subunit beta